MEVMAMPNKETLLFYKQVRPWIISGSKVNDIMVYQFSTDTPASVLSLFEDIKSKLSHPCKAS